MSTFSQLIDELTLEHKRPDLRSVIEAYLNLTTREVHFQPLTGASILYESNRLEDEWTVPSLPATWPIPNAPRFQRFETAYYKNRGCYAHKKHPTRALEHGIDALDPYWYRSGQYLIFNGISVGDAVKQSWFEFPQRLIYYSEAVRPATYNIQSDAFTYLPSYDVDAATRLAAEILVTNWLILRWAEVLKQGVRAKIFARLGEESRAKMAFSAFESLRRGLNTTEANEDNQ